MSKLLLTYLNNSKESLDITGVTVNVMEKFIYIENTNKTYIPLCNVKKIEIIGANQIKEV